MIKETKKDKIRIICMIHFCKRIVVVVVVVWMSNEHLCSNHEIIIYIKTIIINYEFASMNVVFHI